MWLIAGTKRGLVADCVLSLAQIKADRHEIDDAHKDIESLQKQSSESMEKDHEHSKRK